MMHNKFVAGVLIGTAVGMMAGVDGFAKKKMKKTSRCIKNIAGGVMEWIK
ncbi:YtxH domain-containing protein [Clostridium sp. LBM24168]